MVPNARLVDLDHLPNRIGLIVLFQYSLRSASLKETVIQIKFEKYSVRYQVTPETKQDPIVG